MRLLAFFKREAVLTVAALCALATMVLVPPDAAYLGYIDLRVLCLLLCLMAVVAGFQSCGAFRWLAGHLLSRGTGPRALAVILVLLPFFCSMAVTNDVALITFAPFALLLLDQMDCRAAAVPLLVLQTIAANLGSMATPVGNPQNLYLYGAYGLSAGDFFPVVLPLAGISLACLTAAALPVLPRDLQIPPVHPQPLRQPGKLALYGALFLLCLLTVFRILPYGLLTVLVLGTLAAVEPALLRKLDVSLLCTFICFFVVSGNLGRLPAVHGFLQSLLERSTLLTGVLTSQIISNVPAAVLFQVPGDPAGVTGHKVVDAGLGQAAGGPHHHAAVPCDLQGQGLPAGADEFIRFHAVTVAHPAEKRKRGGRDRIRVKRLKGEC